MKRFFLHIILLLFFAIPAIIQAQAFLNEINAFKKADSISYQFANQHPIVFAGSSSFRKWDNMQADFPGFPVLNRGFGGSTLADVIRYANDIIIKYKPKQVVIYCGENDLASPDSITAKTVLKRFKKLFFLIRKELPYASIAFVSIKPSPSRKMIQAKVIEANNMIRKFLNRRDRTVYIDVYYPMLNADGTMRKELFTADDLHMNKDGYVLWQKIIEPYLLR